MFGNRSKGGIRVTEHEMQVDQIVDWIAIHGMVIGNTFDNEQTPSALCRRTNILQQHQVLLVRTVAGDIVEQIDVAAFWNLFKEITFFKPMAGS